MSKILVGTDFSENANHAVNYAARLAMQLHRPLHITCGFQLPVVSSLDAPMAAVSVHEIRNSYQANLNDLVNETKKQFPGLSCEAVLDFGSGWEVMDKHADSTDLLITGESGSGARMGVLLGSTPRELIRHSKKNLMVVPLGTAFRPFKKVALALDLRHEIDFTRFEQLKQLLHAFEGRLLIVSVVSKEHPLNTEKAIAGLSADKVFYDVEHTFHLPENEDTAAAISGFCREHEVDVLALLPGHHNFLEALFGKSISAEVLSKANLAVLCIPA